MMALSSQKSHTAALAQPKSTTANRSRRVVFCTASSRQDTLKETASRIGAALFGTAAAVSLAITPLPAHAVSGGGGMGSSLSYKDLTGQDFRKSNFTKADLRGADFSGANLEGVRLFGAIAVDTKFVGANMRGADLELADLDGADLSNAVLEGALFQNAQMQRIKSIAGADFTDALMRKDIQMGLCKIASGTNPTTGVSTRESLFCP